jgi:NADH-quinone oxidoreductase subunit J
MSHQQTLIALASLLGGASIWLMLPRGGHPGRLLGALLGLVSLGLFGYLAADLVGRLGGGWTEGVFWVVAAVTIISAAAAVTFRSPVYCAVWFALSLLGTAGLFMIQGAQFLAVATIVVYAGAILVTFLFVLMLAQSQGRDYYDRISWEPLLASAAGAVLVGVLTMALVSCDFAKAPTPDPVKQAQEILADDHVAHLGAQLFSHYLIEVEVAGTLLLIALVGTIAMVSHQRAEPTALKATVSSALRAPSSALQEASHG